MITIAHISDTHADHYILEQVKFIPADIIVITGDILGNSGRVRGRIHAELEIPYQEAWLSVFAERWAKAIGSRPVVMVCGNHDFISPSPVLSSLGVEIHELTAENPYADVLGIRFAGFREVPWLDGEWAGEETNLNPYIERALSCNPDVLVTHTPPAGILDGRGYGSALLTSYLTYAQHKVKAHFFGHIHEDGGKTKTQMGIQFINGSGNCLSHTLDLEEKA